MPIRLKALTEHLFLNILKLWEQTSRANSSGIVREELIFERKKIMELRILCKHLVADELNGKFTVGENSANIIGITLPRFYEQYDLSQFSFRITAAGKSSNAAVQILEMDIFDEESVHLLWNVTSDFTVIPKKFTLVLTGVNSDNSVTIKFKSCPVLVNSDETWEFLPSPELSEQLLNQTHSEVQKAIDAANRAEKASQTPAPAEIYPATTERLGGVKVDGQTITASEDGTISAADSETIKSEIADIKSAQNSISSLAVQIAHPNNYLIYDDVGKPSVMVAVPKFYLDEVINGASHTVHPAFIVNGVEQDVIYISKYQNIVENERAYSLPMKKPQININFNTAWNYCKNKGTGWHLMTNAEWAAIALWSKKNGTLPKGNNNYGKDISETDLPQKAIPVSYETNGKISHTANGSGDESWYHNGMFSGISDLNGNVWEWCSGLRLVNGEIQIIADNNAADWNNSVSSDSILWKAIMPDGTLAVPGTSGTLKYASEWANEKFANITVSQNVNDPCAALLKSLLLISDNPSDCSNDSVWISLTSERLPICGGDMSTGISSGIFSRNYRYARSSYSYVTGFRCAYCGNT